MPDNKVVDKKERGKRKRDSKIFMFNAVWFKADGGEERYREYMKAIGPLMRQVDALKLKSFVTDREIIGEFDADLVFFVEYPDWQAYKNFANSADYHKVAYLKEEAVEKSIMVRCKRPERSFRT